MATHDQIDKLTNDVLDAAVAEKVMGWTLIENPNNPIDYSLFRWSGLDGWESQPNYGFAPSTDADDALMVLEHATDSPFGNSRVFYYKEGGLYQARINGCLAVSSKSAGIAICLAALHAVAEVKQ